MEKIDLGIVTCDREFGMALADALTSCQTRFSISVYDANEKDEAINKGHDILIFDHTVENRPQNGIVLVEKESMADSSSYMYYKYRSVKILAGEIIFAYGQIYGRILSDPTFEKTDIAAFSSVRGGSGCTSAAIAFAQINQRFRDKRVLYLTFEDIESTDIYVDCKGGRNIRDFLYFLISGRMEVCSGIEEFVCADDFGMEYFRPSIARNPLSDLSTEDLDLFINYLTHSGRYDLLVADIGNSLSDNAVHMLELSNRIFVIVNREKHNIPINWFIEDAESVADEGIDNAVPAYKDNRRDRYFFYLQNALDLDVFNSIEEIFTFCDEEDMCQGALPYDPESFIRRGDLKQIAMDRSYADALMDII